MVDEYRCKLRATERGLDGEKVALRRVQGLANRVRPQTLLVSTHDHCRHASSQIANTVQGPICVHSIDMGASAPQFSNARITETIGGIVCAPVFFDTERGSDVLVQPQVEFDLSYTDTAFISLSTTVLFNYPFPGFAKLPLSLIISLELFSCKVGGGSYPLPS